MMKYLLTFMIAVVLSGCGLIKPQIVTEYKTKYVVLVPDQDLLVETQKSPPPSRATYMALSETNPQDWRIKEKLLSEAYVKQSAQVDQCNVDKRAITTFIEKAKERYKIE